MNSQPVKVTSTGRMKRWLDWSPDGSRLVYCENFEDTVGLVTIKPDGGDHRRIFTEGAARYHPRFSPDGKRIAYTHTTLSGTDGDFDIHVCFADGSADKKVGAITHWDEQPCWSPDGRFLVYAADKNKNNAKAVGLVRVAADGSSKDVKLLTAFGGRHVHPAFSPDGKHVYFTSDKDGVQAIYRMTAEGGEVTRLIHGERINMLPRPSPDGKRIAFVSNRDGNYEIYLAGADGSNPANLTRHAALDSYPAWSPDGKSLGFISNRDGKFEVHIMDVGAGAPAT
jgi:TolB protein